MAQERSLFFLNREEREFAAISFVSLYLEIGCIRFISAMIGILAYFTNIVLIACFLGLGLGCFMASRKPDLSRLFPVALALIFILIHFYQRFDIHFAPQVDQEILWWRFYPDKPMLGAIYVIATVFFATALLFVPIGQMIGRYFLVIPPLRAYAINIVASLCGVIGFSLVSYLEWPPVLWLAIALVPLIYLLRTQIVVGLATLLVSIFVLVDVAAQTAQSLWSPYYRIELHPKTQRLQDGGEVTFYDVYVNNDIHQGIYDFSERTLQRGFGSSSYLIHKAGYDAPYLVGSPERVLIVGAGTGNDVAAALRHKVRRIDAVEIDPLIYRLGERLHPERPYAAPQVRVFLDDARSFMKRSQWTRETKAGYDLIVFGLVDSHTLLTHRSNIRLDSFLYTEESLREARQLLDPEGVLYLSFWLNRDWMVRKLFFTLKHAFGTDPLVYKQRGLQVFSFYAGSPKRLLEIQTRIHGDPTFDGQLSPEFLNTDKSLDLPTDDWPYLYLRARGIPRDYGAVLLTLFVLSVLSTILVVGTVRALPLHFFFLGSGFLLIETKSITQMSLLFGSTWIVNAVIIAGILATIYLSNLVVTKLPPIRYRILYAGLFVGILANAFFPYNAVSHLSLFWRVLGAMIGVSLPVFFAGMIFSTSFRRTTHVSFAFAANLLGALLGGFGEYLSLYLGFGAMSVTVFFSYGLSALFLLRRFSF